ncbi:glycerate kinase [Geodermatophilus poikilotrophus]|uniref:Glycerate kinase n=1 Tax=Geodermatophilus poikilotrophus TaxID=1333667 RepID=A0A1I0DYP3_9ACTN|nr:glycerate kinase [Geodermatophilus poikilotrophus]SET37675.1 glycerate kinase [Geodermatophilus poikilotrophus]
MPRVFVAPDKFKGSLTATEVAAAVARGFTAGRPDVEVSCLPVADGGDGTLAAALAAGFEAVPVTATGPTGEPVETAFARLGDVAVVEMADVSGLARLPGGRRAARTATSRGTGEVVAAALAAGARRVVLGIGGSATTDGGAGLLQALGAELLDADGAPIGPGGAGLEQLARVDVSGVAAALGGAEVVVASDVDNPLTGPSGAAAVYGPQKGADPDDVAYLDRCLTRLADAVADATGRDLRDEPGAGAAGGVGFAALAVLGAQLRPGIDLLLDLLGFERLVAGADLVVVGEGSLDEQSLRGKAPVGVARRARAAGVPEVIAVCGRRDLDDAALREAGIDAAAALTDIEPDPDRCMTEAGPLLERLARRIAAEHLPTPT